MLQLCSLIMVLKNVGGHTCSYHVMFLCSATVARVFSLLICNHSQYLALEDYIETAVMLE